MNEDERGITPANVTAITVEHRDSLCFVTIEQGNGDVIKTIELTKMERMMLSGLLENNSTVHAEFTDFSR